MLTLMRITMLSWMILVLSLVVTIVTADNGCNRGQTCMEDVLCSLCGQRSGNLFNSGRQVAFYAYMSRNLPIRSLRRHKVYVYDKVETNIGNAYNLKTGKFTAPVGGVYAFHVTTASGDYSFGIAELVVNGVLKDVGFADSGNHKDRDTTSTFTIVTLKKGDVVNTRVGHIRGGRYLESNSVYCRISFSGFRIA